MVTRYLHGTRRIDGKRRTISRHREVWEQAHGPIPEGMIVHHRDHDKRNNALSNLQLMTPQDHARHHNQRHAYTKPCAVCGVTFTPAPTKRKRAQTCSRDCMRTLMSQRKRARDRQAVAPATAVAD